MCVHLPALGGDHLPKGLASPRVTALVPGGFQRTEALAVTAEPGEASPLGLRQASVSRPGKQGLTWTREEGRPFGVGGWGRTHPHGGPGMQPSGKRALSFRTGDAFSTLVARLRATRGRVSRREPSTCQDLHPVYGRVAQICLLRGLSSYPVIRVPPNHKHFSPPLLLHNPWAPREVPSAE